MTRSRSVIEIVVDGKVASVIELAADSERGARPRVVVREPPVDGDRDGDGADDGVDIPRLTEREKEVLDLIAAGHSTREVADRLFISQKTVRNHLASVYRKLDARSRAEAVVSGLRLGIVRSA
jgi:two-component system, NarL family, response regulator DegU